MAHLTHSHERANQSSRIQNILAKIILGHKRDSIWFLPLVGLAALVWFILRVVPKPSRAAYPCQRIALPLAGGFFVWAAGLIGSTYLFRKGQTLLRQKKMIKASFCLVVGTSLGFGILMGKPDGKILAEPQINNDPVGVARGLNPGRVVWVHDPEATDWQGVGYGHWWEPEHTIQGVVDEMMSHTLRWLSGRLNDYTAWDALFRFFNQSHGGGDVGYTPGEKIVIKVNFVGCHYEPSHGGVDPETYDLVEFVDYMNTSPQVIVALLRQLVDVVGVEQEDISVGDPMALFPNQYYDICHAEFPNVHYLDHWGGNPEHPRTGVEYSNIPFYWSCHPSGTSQDYVPVSFAEAKYLINLANFKSHSSAGVTFCAKNHYGSLIRHPVAAGYYSMHLSLANNVPTDGNYRATVDLLGHAHTGGKTLLYLIDGLYSGVHPYEQSPRHWECEPFNDDWTSSLFASQDPVALESVGFDLMQLEGDPLQFPQRPGVDDYLHEAALADNPPSGTYYDPDHDGDISRLPSLGVHEHWNNPTDRQYSRNLGTGDGIELIRLGPVTAVPQAESTLDLASFCYPNPFNPMTNIHFELPSRLEVELSIYNVQGERVATILNAVLPAGSHETIWEGRDSRGHHVASGTYFYHIAAADYVETGRMVLAK